MKRAITLGTLFALACVLIVSLPASAAPNRWDGWKPYETHYLGVYEKCWKAFKADCGANIVDDQTAKNKAQVEESSARMEGWLNPPAQPAVDSPVVVADAPAGTSVPPASGALPACAMENPGQPTVVNPSSGAGGIYQIIPSTWAANGGGEYAATADQATVEQQTAVAQNVLASQGSSAWVNC